MFDLPLGASTWTFNGLLPKELRGIVNSSEYYSTEQFQAIHAYFVEIVSAILHSKIEAVELWYSTVFHDPFVYEQLERLSSSDKVVSMHGPTARCDLASLDDEVRVGSVEEYMRSAQMLKDLGGSIVVIHPAGQGYGKTDMQAAFEKSTVSIKEIAARCHDIQLSVAVENQAPPMLGGSRQEFMSLLDAVKGSNVGACLDVNHIFPPDDLIPMVCALGANLYSLHISDYDGIDEKHWLPGRGVIHWWELMEALTNIGYSGSLMYEIYPEAAGPNELVAMLEENYREITETSNG